MRIYSQADVGRLIALIYDAALAPEGWGRFLDELATTVDGHCVSLASINVSRPGIAFMAKARFDPAFLAEYETHYCEVDPWVDAAARQGLLKPGLVDLGENFVSHEALKKTEFYSGVGRRFNFLGGISAVFEGDHSLLGLSLSQHKPHQFGCRELDLVRTLLPHVGRAMRVHQRLQTAEDMAAAGASALDQSSHGVLFMSSRGTVVFANRAAQDILNASDGLILDHGELRASTAAETTELRVAIRAAVVIANGVVATGKGIMLVTRPSGLRSLSIVVVPVSPKNHVATDPAAARAAVFVTDPERTTLPDTDSIRRLFQLTPAEARLLQRLAGGDTLDEAAHRLGIALDTARKRLKMIFVKTETHRQAELMRLVLTSTGLL